MAFPFAEDRISYSLNTFRRTYNKEWRDHELLIRAVDTL